MSSRSGKSPTAMALGRRKRPYLAAHSKYFFPCDLCVCVCVCVCVGRGGVCVCVFVCECVWSEFARETNTHVPSLLPTGSSNLTPTHQPFSWPSFPANGGRERERDGDGEHINHTPRHNVSPDKQQSKARKWAYSPTNATTPRWPSALTSQRLPTTIALASSSPSASAIRSSSSFAACTSGLNLPILFRFMNARTLSARDGVRE
jgi:hypothetical protein